MIYFGYIMTFFNYICYCSSRFMKEKTYMLLLDILAKISTIIALICLGSLTGSYNMIISLILLIIARKKEKGKILTTKISSNVVFILFVCSYLFSMTLTFKGISSILVTITSVITLISIWYLPPQKMRIVGACNSVIFLCYQMSIRNYVGILEILVILSNIVAFVKYKKLNSKRQV